MAVIKKTKAKTRQPGPVLDTEIAEIMGYSTMEVAGEICVIDEYKNLVGFITGGIEPKMNYSQNLGLAIEAMYEYTSKLNIEYAFTRKNARFGKSEPRFYCRIFGLGYQHASGSAESAPLAVCRAMQNHNDKRQILIAKT